MLVLMGDIYRMVSKKNRRGYGGLSISLADKDFQEDEVWDAYEGRSEYESPPKCENFRDVQPQKSSGHPRTGQPSRARMIGRDKSISYPAKATQHSVPISIPDWSKNRRHGSSPADYMKAADEENENNDVYELPPHEWLLRKHSRNQMSSFSVVEGAGRTLKGRDLSKVRDSVLTRTGFLE